MKKTHANLGELKLAGIATRTSNALEKNPETAKIGKMFERYFGNKLNRQISNRVSPGKTYCVYTNYKSDEKEAYDYVICEEVSSFIELQPEFYTLVIPAGSYAKFEVGPGAMPAICIRAWEKIWLMKAADFGDKRTFIADFEVYDERAIDPTNSVLDVYIGIQRNGRS